MVSFCFFSCSYRFFVVSFYINTMVFYKTQLNLSELISYFKFGVKFGAKFPQVQRGTWELSSELEVPRKFISSARDLSELVVTSNHFNLLQLTSSLPLSACKSHKSTGTFKHTRMYMYSWWNRRSRIMWTQASILHLCLDIHVKASWDREEEDVLNNKWRHGGLLGREKTTGMRVIP